MSLYKSDTLGLSSGGELTEVIDDTGDGNQTRSGESAASEQKRVVPPGPEG